MFVALKCHLSALAKIAKALFLWKGITEPQCHHHEGFAYIWVESWAMTLVVLHMT